VFCSSVFTVVRIGIHMHRVDDTNVGMLLDQILKRHAHMFLVRTPGFPTVGCDQHQGELSSGMPAKGVFSQECGSTLKARKVSITVFPVTTIFSAATPSARITSLAL
jgi:hypothetical protein